MSLPEIKYAIGDKVFFAGTAHVEKKHPCPDCFDTHRWTATSPAGEEYGMSCPRCCSRSFGDDKLSLKYWEYVPSIRELTIGSIRLDTSDKSPVGYMCVETGVGSGSVYRQDQLLQTHEEARVVAQLEAIQKNKRDKYEEKKYQGYIHLTKEGLDSAALSEARELKEEAKRMLRAPTRG